MFVFFSQMVPVAVRDFVVYLLLVACSTTSVDINLMILYYYYYDG